MTAEVIAAAAIAVVVFVVVVVVFVGVAVVVNGQNRCCMLVLLTAFAAADVVSCMDASGDGTAAVPVLSIGYSHCCCYS